ncbi:MAG: aminoacyl-tRNA hydrolase [Betaproteobacteria bacterium]|nr:MAG: aminoacyl-tRNA hydrolase [Betaproteobacteria bacterium]
MTQLATSPIKLVVGLGNPGPEYERTRHNAGFWFAEDIAHEIGGSLSSEKKFHGLIARGTASSADIRALQPQTFMNLSGNSVAAVAKFFEISPEAILVAHDELDLDAGEIKLKFGGGHAGHNGLRDIQAKLGTGNYWRLRIGIGHPRDSVNPHKPVADWVLERARRDEQEAIEAAIERALAVWPMMARGDMESAIKQLHTKPKTSNASSAA